MNSGGEIYDTYSNWTQLVLSWNLSQFFFLDLVLPKQKPSLKYEDLKYFCWKYLDQIAGASVPDNVASGDSYVSEVFLENRSSDNCVRLGENVLFSKFHLKKYFRWP